MAATKIGVVGVGKMGEYHVGVLSEMLETDLVGIVDNNKERANLISQRYSVPCYYDCKDLIKKVDMVITLAGKNPTILIECKKAGANLTSGNFNQLSEYFKTQISSKIGILTNGLVYKFYSSSLDDKRILNTVPFLTFDLTDFNSSDIEP